MRNLSLGFTLALCLTAAACGPRDKDKLDDKELAGTPGGADKKADTRCISRAVTDEVKRQLFARAAQIRGSNGDNYAKIAGYSLIELNGSAPLTEVAEDEQIDCQGNATLRLPAGLKVAGGRTALGGDISYTVAPGARGQVTLGQSDSISIPLATLTQDRAAAPRPSSAPARQDPLAPAASEPSPPSPPSPPEIPDRPVASPPPPPPAPTASQVARPSFNCRRARTAGERMVCANPPLADLDREMAAQYRSAVANGGPRERALLVETRDNFLRYRDRCDSSACIAITYRGRMREIADIAAGRWRGR